MSCLWKNVTVGFSLMVISFLLLVDPIILAALLFCLGLFSRWCPLHVIQMVTFPVVNFFFVIVVFV